jgi:hypothetical protein
MSGVPVLGINVEGVVTVPTIMQSGQDLARSPPIHPPMDPCPPVFRRAGTNSRHWLHRPPCDADTREPTRRPGRAGPARSHGRGANRPWHPTRGLGARSSVPSVEPRATPIVEIHENPSGSFLPVSVSAFLENSPSGRGFSRRRKFRRVENVYRDRFHSG